MAKVRISYEILGSNRVRAIIFNFKGNLFGKENPFYYSKMDENETGICPSIECQHSWHCQEIERTFPTAKEAVEWTEGIVREIKEAQAAYLAVKETLKRELPPEREIEFPE